MYVCVIYAKQFFMPCLFMYGTFAQIETDTTKIRSGSTRRLKRALNNGEHVVDELFYVLQLPTTDAHCNHITGMVMNITSPVIA
jgi:hypothetical protein